MSHLNVGPYWQRELRKRFIKEHGGEQGEKSMRRIPKLATEAFDFGLSGTYLYNPDGSRAYWDWCLLPDGARIHADDPLYACEPPPENKKQLLRNLIIYRRIRYDEAVAAFETLKRRIFFTYTGTFPGREKFIGNIELYPGSFKEGKQELTLLRNEIWKWRKSLKYMIEKLDVLTHGTLAERKAKEASEDQTRKQLQAMADELNEIKA